MAQMTDLLAARAAPLSHFRLPRRDSALLAASLLTVMSGATIAPALPELAAHFADTPDAAFLVRLVLTVPGLFIALGAPLAGFVADRWARKPLLLVGLVVYGLAGGSALVLDSLGAILAGRALLGLAVAAIMTVTTTLIGDYFAGAARNRFMGWQAAAMGFGGVIFLLTGGALADIGWRAPFGVYLLAWLVLPLAAVALPEPARHSTPAPREAPTVAVPLGATALVYAVALGSVAASYLIPTQLPFYLTERLGVSNSLTGLAIAVMSLASALVALQFGRLRARLGLPALFVLLFALMGGGFLGLAAAASYPAVLVSMVVCGLALGLLMPGLATWLLASAPEQVRGRLVGGLTACIFLGQFLSPLAARPLLASQGPAGTFACTGALLVVAAAALVAVAVRPRWGGA